MSRIVKIDQESMTNGWAGLVEREMIKLGWNREESLQKRSGAALSINEAFITLSVVVLEIKYFEGGVSWESEDVGACWGAFWPNCRA